VSVLLEWGPVGAAVLAESCDVLVIVDVLSFTTCVSVACARGATGWPHRWLDSSATERAAALAALVALVASPRAGSGLSLSPVSLRDLPHGSRLVLPSPNGSTIAAAAASDRAVVAAAGRVPAGAGRLAGRLIAQPVVPGVRGLDAHGGVRRGGGWAAGQVDGCADRGDVQRERLVALPPPAGGHFVALVRGVPVEHLMPNGRRTAHPLTDGVRLAPDGLLGYDAVGPP